MNYPTDSLQHLFDYWWIKDKSNKVQRGSLIYAFVPYVEQVPITLTPVGRKKADQHDEAKIYISPLRIKDRRPRKDLPVAALSIHDDEIWTAFRAKKRPCLVIGEEMPEVAAKLTRNMPKRATAPTLLVAPYYGAVKYGKRSGYNTAIVERIRHAEYPQFFWDTLPIPGGIESILRFDHIQSIGFHYYAYELTGFRLSDEAISEFLNDWIKWFLFGGLPEKSIILDYQKEIKSIFT